MRYARDATVVVAAGPAVLGWEPPLTNARQQRRARPQQTRIWAQYQAPLNSVVAYQHEAKYAKKN